ncbi:MAG: hypothetical protein ACJAT2_001338 [Bacteriovoracaceae bacterium]|jgi:hypothetical protein
MKATSLPNARLLYSKTDTSKDWMTNLISIDLAIESHPRLQRASNRFHLYFFKPGSEIQENEEIWVGREVSGFMNPGELEGLETYDLLKGVGFEEEFEVSEGLSLQDLLNREKKLRSELKATPASTWRVSFLETESGIKGNIGLFKA